MKADRPLVTRRSKTVHFDFLSKYVLQFGAQRLGLTGSQYTTLIIHVQLERKERVGHQTPIKSILDWKSLQQSKGSQREILLWAFGERMICNCQIICMSTWSRTNYNMNSKQTRFENDGNRQRMKINSYIGIKITNTISIYAVSPFSQFFPILHQL